MSLLTDLQSLAEHLSPSDVQADGRVVGALVKVLEHEGLKVPELDELLPEEHPARVAPPAPAAPAAQDTTGLGSRLSNIEAALAKLLGGHQTSVEQAGPAAGAETPAPSSEPAAAPVEPAAPAVETAPQAERTDAPELDRP